MKKIFCLFIVLLLGGCAGLTATYAPFASTSINTGEEKTAGIGDIFYEFAQGQTMTDPMIAARGITASGEKFDLTIVELNKDKIGLQYNEFVFTPGALIGYTYIPGAWMVKQGFNKRFDYAITDKVIRFKGYDFEILSVENGQIKYRRIK